MSATSQTKMMQHIKTHVPRLSKSAWDFVELSARFVDALAGLSRQKMLHISEDLSFDVSCTPSSPLCNALNAIYLNAICRFDLLCTGFKDMRCACVWRNISLQNMSLLLIHWNNISKWDHAKYQSRWSQMSTCANQFVTSWNCRRASSTHLLGFDESP